MTRNQKSAQSRFLFMEMEMVKKIHWMKLPKNKGKVMKMIRKMHRAKRLAAKHSKAERLVRRHASPNGAAPELTRMHLYIRAVKAASESGELHRLVAEIRERALANLFGGGQ